MNRHGTLSPRQISAALVQGTWESLNDEILGPNSGIGSNLLKIQDIPFWFDIEGWLLNSLSNMIAAVLLIASFASVTLAVEVPEGIHIGMCFFIIISDVILNESL